MKKMAVYAVVAALTLFAVQVFAADIKIGVSFSDFETERWPVEAELMEKLAKEQGAEVIVQAANHDAKIQNDQISNMILQGVDVIIIIAEDGAAAAAAVDEAAQDNIPVIAYDRLVKSDKLAAYISFDNVEVGRTQARGVLKVVDKGKFIMLGGSPTDNNAVLFRKGQMEVVQPLVDSGQITIVGDQWVENWQPANATQLMENMLTAVNNDVDAVIASNDGTALGALQALKAQGLAGKVPISGQDATAAGCKSIVEDELTMTVFKDVRLLTPMAIDMAVKLAKGEKIEGLQEFTLAELTLDDNLVGTVPCKFLKVVEIDKGNVYEEIVKSGFQSYDDIYKDIPEDQRPPKL
ncbi:D-xylose transporter subunit XylF [candidate division KSB3 bacterium]|uniref:D-xylose transporter subunit XylF n=1 Tax=candidate division KSB3 bacterium TaxID=2044937 RepID=A0A2G6E6S9_9BACT|nr:MAG: D-xylose transporter subunit XylF [candidate division KSB3 bacterium]PIE30168.1 MAG: D-xylose transporter subunit XylF [candidate division KSB3 bacterium]